uniref:Uncharacterized protein n=1 Tax=Lactuca sativa TaxID=4236 RepID=A0A9R1VMQ6_LACSA|nr:hypothetical protein LSAT_V11C400169340 [Lactuca sativa]
MSNLFIGPLEEIKQKKMGLSASRSKVIDHFGDKFDRYVQIQETKAEMMIQVEQKMLEAQNSFQEAQMILQIKTDMEILKTKENDLDGEDLEIFLMMKESVRVIPRNRREVDGDGGDVEVEADRSRCLYYG